MVKSSGWRFQVDLIGSQIPDEGKAGPQSQLNEAWMIKSQKGWMPGFFSMRSFFGMVTCIFRMWFAWQTPWKTSGMQTGGTKCLSATFLVKSYHFVVVLPACQTCSVNMRPETGTLRPRYVRWFEDRWSVILLTRLPLHPKGACDSKFKFPNISKELPTWQTYSKHFRCESRWSRFQPQCRAPHSRAQSLPPPAVRRRAGIGLCRSSPPRQPTLVRNSKWENGTMTKLWLSYDNVMTKLCFSSSQILYQNNSLLFIERKTKRYGRQIYNMCFSSPYFLKTIVTIYLYSTSLNL